MEQVTVVEDDEMIERETALEDSGMNSLQLNLHASGVALQMRTQISANAQVVELTTRLAVATEQLAAAQTKVENACHRIGFLEAQLAERERLIEVLSRP